MKRCHSCGSNIVMTYQLPKYPEAFNQIKGSNLKILELGAGNGELSEFQYCKVDGIKYGYTL